MLLLQKRCKCLKALLIENGDIVEILPGKEPTIIDKAPSGKLYLDGTQGVEARLAIYKR